MPHPRFILFAACCAFTLTGTTGCSPAAQESSINNFDGKRAYDILKKQVEFGPRVPDTPAHDACANFIASSLKVYTDEVSTQEFERTVGGKPIHLKNIVGYFNPKAERWILLAAHWDSRPTADCEIDAAKKKMPISGANDGASGVAVLLELARMFGERKPNIGIVMVFFDGEDYGQTSADMFLGSKQFASNIAKNASINGKSITIDYGILLDMVGDKDLNIYQESNSLKAAPEVVRKVWKAAKVLGHSDIFKSEERYSISDDHIPLIKAGVKCIDVIDFEYAPWHTLDDTSDKCSAKSLGIVGNVIASVVYSEKS